MWWKDDRQRERERRKRTERERTRPSVDHPRWWWGLDDEEVVVGSSHVDRNGPTKFYPTIREARRGSGPRPTAATARSARAAFLRVELRLSSDQVELRARERQGRREREGEKRGGGGVIQYTVKATTARTRESLPRAPPQRKGSSSAWRSAFHREIPRECPRCPRAKEQVLLRISARTSLFSEYSCCFLLCCLPPTSIITRIASVDAPSAPEKQTCGWKCPGRSAETRTCRRVLATPSSFRYPIPVPVNVARSWLVSRLEFRGYSSSQRDIPPGRPAQLERAAVFFCRAGFTGVAEGWLYAHTGSVAGAEELGGSVRARRGVLAQLPRNVGTPSPGEVPWFSCVCVYTGRISTWPSIAYVSTSHLNLERDAKPRYSLSLGSLLHPQTGYWFCPSKEVQM